MNVSTQTDLPPSINNLTSPPLSPPANESFGNSLNDWSSANDPKENVYEPSSLSVKELAFYTQKEMRRYLQTGESNTHYGFELFRRALDMQDEAAWYALLQLYNGLVKSWVTNHSKFASSGEDADYFVNRAFERLWRYVALKPGKFANFTDIAALLQYTKMCVHAAVMDDAPTQPAVTDLTGPNGEHAVELGIHHLSDGQQSTRSQFDQDDFEHIEKSEFWQLVEEFLMDESERIVIFGFFVEGIKNRELLAIYPDHFEDAKQISNKRTSILRRLSRNPHFTEILQDFFHDDRDRFGTLIC